MSHLVQSRALDPWQTLGSRQYMTHPACLDVLRFCHNRKGPLRSCPDWKIFRSVMAQCPSANSSLLWEAYPSCLDEASVVRQWLVWQEEQERALQLLTSLQSLNLLDLPNLLSLPANLASLTSLERLSIHGCPRIKSLPEMGLPPSLRGLSLGGCSDELSMQCRMAATEKLQVWIDGKIID